MADKYVMDSCALLAHIYDETGADIVESLLEQATTGAVSIFMNKLNLYEVYYDIVRSEGQPKAESVYTMIMMSPIQIINGISDNVFREGARIKIRHRMSLADSIALGEASIMGAAIITSDHHEFDPVERNEKINFKWIR